MLEVVFSDSTKAAMKMAKTYNKDSMLESTIGYIGIGKKPSKKELEKQFDPLGVGDRWYALRIKKMIDENKLEVVEVKDSSHPYGIILKKVIQ